MFGHVLTALVSFLILQASPSVVWKAIVNHSEGNNYQLVVTGQIARDYYVHPMSDPYVGTELQVEAGDGIVLTSEVVEEFTPSDYKGETEVTGTYVLKQDLQIEGAGKVTGTSSQQQRGCRMARSSSSQDSISAAIPPPGRPMRRRPRRTPGWPWRNPRCIAESSPGRISSPR